ncbi:MAG: hypothetical protein HW405_490 [Candidatus Berkelbacteria bacterium]|nr:hypothetical protein [Candidatus Berkelbacteria bacterium]
MARILVFASGSATGGGSGFQELVENLVGTPYIRHESLYWLN